MAQTTPPKQVTPPQHYTFAQLEKLWTDAGGPKALAPIMAAIALAESNGNPSATHRNSNGSTDRGLWQINSVHKYGQSSMNPQQNAKQAVSIYHSQGLSAWSTFKNGAYLKPLKENVKGKDLAWAQLRAKEFANQHSNNPLGTLRNPVTAAEQGATSAIGDAASAAVSPIADAVTLGLKEAMYALVIVGGMMLILLGLLMIGVDIGLSGLQSRASNHPATRILVTGSNRVSNYQPKGTEPPNTTEKGGGDLPGPDA